MASSLHLTVPADEGRELVELDVGELSSGEMATVTTGSSGVGLGLAGTTESPASGDGLPLAIVLVAVVLIIVGVTAGIFGLRSMGRTLR